MTPHKKYIMTMKDINYMKESNKIANKFEDKYFNKVKSNKKVVDSVIRLNEKDTPEYKLVTKVMHNCIVIAVTAAIFACGYYLGTKHERNVFEKRAVEAGVGEYIIVDPYTGESQFDFINPKEISRTFGMIE